MHESPRRPANRAPDQGPLEQNRAGRAGGAIGCPDSAVGHRIRGYLQDTYAESGAPEELMKKNGLVAENIVAAARRVLVRK